ncbi:hypothetical protein [Pseudomonas tussilaginis]|uniref:hypothetical protein n=1 Tax=Pseudomonas sp. 5 TaxID=1619949 RepID=UPI0005EBC472|nr:hypothetical protein [Pseudomonas sp. 5]KJK04662.1 hypothetical protein UB47_23295 [Pseudomonas sp. 5]
MGKISTNIQRDKIIRRYMSLDKFEKLLSSQSLYFSRFDGFEDKLEGGINTNNYPSFSNSLAILDAAILAWPTVEPRNEKNKAALIKAQQKIEQETFPSLFGIQQKIDGDAYLQNISSWLYASCWTDLEHECQAMWQLYGCPGGNCRHDPGCTECLKTRGESICIETTIGAIIDNIELKKDYNLKIQKVEYLNHRKTRFEDNDLIFRPFFSKALHFSYEHEVRFMLWPDRDDVKFSYKNKKSSENNIASELLPIKNLERFIGKIILSPLPYMTAKEIRTHHIEHYQSTHGLEHALSNFDLRNKVRKVCAANNINIPIIESDLNQITPTDCYSYVDEIQ